MQKYLAFVRSFVAVFTSVWTGLYTVWFCPVLSTKGKAGYWERRQLPFPTSNFLPGFCSGSGAVLNSDLLGFGALRDAKKPAKYVVSGNLVVCRAAGVVVVVMARPKEIDSKIFIEELYTKENIWKYRLKTHASCNRKEKEELAKNFNTTG